MSLALTPAIYAPGASGVPSTATPRNIGQRIDSYTHTISATGGFESATFGFTGTIEEGLYWLRHGPMCSVVVSGPDAEIMFEGFVSRVTFSVGGQTRSVDIGSMVNRARVRYTDVNGGARTTVTGSSVASIARFGTKDAVLSLDNTDKTPAENYRDTMLSRSGWPRMEPQSQVSTGKPAANLPTVEISCTGWYYALDWLVTSNTSLTSVATNTQIATLLNAYNAVNPFLTVDTRYIEASGVNAPETIEPDTTYRARIEALLSLGTSITQRLAYGVYANRLFKAATWAGATPSVITYRGRLASGLLVNEFGARVEPWNVRPDAMLEIVDLLDPSPVSTAPDAAARQYIERVTCNVSAGQWSVTLEPENTDSLGAILAFRNTKYPWR